MKTMTEHETTKMDTVSLIQFCDANPILQELTQKYWRDSQYIRVNSDADSDTYWGKCEAFKESIDCAIRLIRGGSDAALREQILKLFEPIQK